MRDSFLPESDRATRIQGSNREPHCVRTYIRIAIYDGFHDETETTKLCHAKTFPGLYQYLFEAIDGEEEIHKFALHSPFWR